MLISNATCPVRVIALCCFRFNPWIASIQYARHIRVWEGDMNELGLVERGLDSKKEVLEECDVANVKGR